MIKIGNTNIISVYKGDTEVVSVYKGTNLVYTKDKSKSLFTIKSLENNNSISWLKEGSAAKLIYWRYHLDGFYSPWTATTSTTSGSFVTLLAGETILICGTNSSYATSTSDYSHFSSSGDAEIYGNIMSLCYDETNFANATSLPSGSYTFAGLFRSWTKLKSSADLALPATTIREYCYINMFRDCTSMEHSIKTLSATTLLNSCYANMFKGCSSLRETVSVLPATNAVYGCYGAMYSGASSITSVLLDMLRATTVGELAYSAMFYYCSGLTNVPNLPATTLGTLCYMYMFEGCTSLITVPTNLLQATTLASQCYMGMFYDCTSLSVCPNLPASTLTYRCYHTMFRGCTSLTVGSDMSAATTLAEQCCYNMFRMCYSLLSVRAMPSATTAASECYTQMFCICTSLTAPPEINLTTLDYGCCSGMFAECSSLLKSPVLKAQTLTTNCYALMFSKCSSLSEITCLATDISATDCTNTWVIGVAASGTFIKAASITGWTTGDNGIPNGWTVENYAQPSDIVLANKSDNSLKIVPNDEWSISAYPASDWEPVGVVVIPGTHGYIKDGDGTTNQCAVISIVPMKYSTPETGGTSEGTMYWGGYGTDISGKSDGLGRYDSYSGDGLRNYNKVAVTADATSNTASGLSSISYAYISRQAAIGGTPTRNNSPYAPSPYNGSDYKSGEYNDSYGTTSFDSGSNYNVLADVRGIVNTKIITDMATAESWKTLSSLTNSYSSGYYPAACCCARYHTRGTKAFKDCTDSELKSGTGFWYMPSAGELGYILPRLYDINDTISKLNASYGVGVQLASNIWSSSEYSSNRAYAVSMFNGGVYGSYGKDEGGMVRALCRL